MQEEWRSFIENYEVSSQGRIRRSTPGRKTYAGRVMKQQMLKNGYMSVRPTVNGKNLTILVHSAVASAFIGKRESDAFVNHIDGNKLNNTPGNLEYTTHAGNMDHASRTGLMAHGSDHYKASLTEDSVLSLRADRSSGMSFSELARKYGISITAAFNAAKGNNWKHIK